MGIAVKISSVVMTYNEEACIARCLESLEEVSDEILVVDSYSTDRTVEIAKSFGARILLHDFEGYVEQRNYGLEKAQYTHVLALDADEALSIELIREIRMVKQDWTKDAYSFNRRNYFCGDWIRHGLWYPDTKLRLLDKTKGRSTGVNPHDKITMDPGAITGKLNGDLLHYTVSSVSEYINQVNRFSTIQSKSPGLKNLRPNFFHLCFKPLYKFMVSYIFRLGFLDGWRGLCIALGQSWGIYLRYIKVVDNRRDELA